MWHVSVSRADEPRKVCLEELEQVGSVLLGQWEELGPRAFHLRRRLSPKEAESVGPIIDVRGTPQAAWRRYKMNPYLPPNYPQE